jgi:hypothetical protein
MFIKNIRELPDQPAYLRIMMKNFNYSDRISCIPNFFTKSGEHFGSVYVHKHLYIFKN